MKQSRQGLISAFIPLGIVALEIIGIGLAAALDNGGPGAKGGIFVIGFFSCGSVVGAFVGLILGIVGLRLPMHAKSAAIVGIVINGLFLGYLMILLIAAFTI